MQNTQNRFHPIDIDSSSSESEMFQVRRQVSFCALGDIPYSPPQEGKLRDQLADLPSSCDFVVHVGDIMKAHRTGCQYSAYTTVDNILRTSPRPLFLLPGDNDMMQCPDQRSAWNNWKAHFYDYDRHFDNVETTLKINRQTERNENFSFLHMGVLFVGINHVAGDNIVDLEGWIQQDLDNLLWMKQNLYVYGDAARSLVFFTHAIKIHRHYDFFVPFLDLIATSTFGSDNKPILMLHGDGHVWEYEPKWNGVKGKFQNLKVKNILRVQVARGGLAPPVKVTIGFDEKNPFEFDQRL
jgi:hypothetical protein